MNSLESNPEILEARKKLAEKFGNLKIGGKGKRQFLQRLPKKKGSTQTQVFRCAR
jgi:hypothetical protein